jgi:hypothetical protein
MYGGVALASDSCTVEQEYSSCQPWYNKGYKDGQASYDCRSERSQSYNDGYRKGLDYRGGYDGGYKSGHSVGYKKGTKYRGGYDGGYKSGHKKGYDDGYSVGDKDGYKRGRDSYDDNGSYGVCAFVFKFDGFINISNFECNGADQCEDNDQNTINVCIVRQE